VRKFSRETARELEEIEADWYPLVVQEFVSGTEVSLEALFRNGKLVAWLYSEMVETMGDFGPSTTRRYFMPEVRDFELVLSLLGADGGLNGMFNVAMIWSPTREAHFLFELDPRPNTWHQFGKHFGVDWVEAMLGSEAITGASHAPATPASETDEFIHLYPRALKHALNTRGLGGIRPWLTAAPGTWSSRNHKDHAINRYELREVIFWFSGPSIAMAAKVWQALPPWAQRILAKLGVKRAVIYLVGA
jgi:predicted ATP-grasp superfamily ATP-dependent carboligase